jgi:hypothetical protein
VCTVCCGILIIGGVIGVFVRLGQQRDAVEFERNLLRTNPSAWQAKWAVEMDREDRKLAAVAKGAQFGIGALLRVLRK